MPADTENEHTFRFRHALIRDVAYAAMPKSVRSDLHEAFANWLETQVSRGFGEHPEIVGYHAEQAFRLRTELGLRDERTRELGSRAADLLTSAGRRAASRDDIPAAIALLERADALLPEQSPLRGAIRHSLGRGLWEIGENERAIQVLETAIEDASRAGDVRSEWMARLDRAAFRLVLGLGDELRDVATEAIDVLSTTGDDAGLALAWRRLAFADRRDGRYGASVEPSERALAHARAASDAYEETRAVDSLCTGLLYGPASAADAAARCRDLLASAEGRPVLRANVLASLAELEAMLGHFDSARDAYARSRSIYEELGLRMPLAGLTTIGVELELLADAPEAGEAEARRGMDVLRGTGLEVELAPLLAEALLRQGRDDDAFAALDGIADEERRGIPWKVRLHTAQARLLARRPGGADGGARPGPRGGHAGRDARRREPLRRCIRGAGGRSRAGRTGRRSPRRPRGGALALPAQGERRRGPRYAAGPHRVTAPSRSRMVALSARGGRSSGAYRGRNHGDREAGAR